jgi:D-alanine transaminase
MELKGSKTEQNLMAAFAGESQARNKYTYFASVAKKEGYEQISEIFSKTADNEKEHAKMWFKLLGELGDNAHNLLAAAEGDAHMLYLQVTRGAAPRKHEYPEGVAPNLIMFVKPVAVAPKDKRVSLISLEDLRFQYCNIKTTNLMPNVFASEKATRAGADEVLWHRGERVTEAAHSSILMIKDGAVIMPPLDEYVLPGITRRVLHDVCDQNGIPVSVRTFTVDEIMHADEVILCSTTKNVLYVYDIDGTPVGGKDQILAHKLQELFLDEVYRQTGVRV